MLAACLKVATQSTSPRRRLVVALLSKVPVLNWIFAKAVEKEVADATHFERFFAGKQYDALINLHNEFIRTYAAFHDGPAREYKDKMETIEQNWKRNIAGAHRQAVSSIARRDDREVHAESPAESQICADCGQCKGRALNSGTCSVVKKFKTWHEEQFKRELRKIGVNKSNL